MNNVNKISPHHLTVKKPLSKIYLALFAAPLAWMGSVDMARAADTYHDTNVVISAPVVQPDSIYIGNTQGVDVLIDDTTVEAKNIFIGTTLPGDPADDNNLLTVKGPLAQLTVPGSLDGGVLNIGQGTLKVEDGAQVNAEIIEVGSMVDFYSHLNVTGADTKVESEILSLGEGVGSSATMLIEDGATVTTRTLANIFANSPTAGSDAPNPKATVTGNNSAWNIAGRLKSLGDVDILDGGAVNVGIAEFTGKTGSSKMAKLHIAGEGSSFTSTNDVTAGADGNGLVSVAEDGFFSAGANELRLGEATGAGKGVLIIGSRGDMDNVAAPGELLLGAAGAAGTVDKQTVINLDGGMDRSYVYFNHTSDDYNFANKMMGEGDVINTAGQTTLSGDLTALKANVSALGGKIIIASDLNTLEETDPLAIQTLSAENGGTLILNASAGSDIVGSTGYSSEAVIKSGGILGGNGTLGQTVIQDGGHISPGDGNIGTLTLKRNLTFLGESFYDVDIAGDGGSDRLEVSGVTTISDRAKVQVTALDPQTSYQTAQNYNILTSTGGINGEFAQAVTDSAFLDLELTHSADSVDLSIAVKDTGTPDPIPEPDQGGDSGQGENPGQGGDSGQGENPGQGGGPGIFQTVAQSANQWNTAGALATLGQSGPSLALYNSVLMLSAPEARDAFNQLSGEIYPSVQSNLISNSAMLVGVLNQRMLNLFDNDPLPVPPLAMSLVQPAHAEQNGVWGQNFGSWSRSNGNGEVGKLAGDTHGFLLGADRKLSDHNIRVGGYAGYSHGNYEVDSRRSKTTSDSYHVGLYAAGQQDAFSLRGGVGYSKHRLEGERNVAFSGYSDKLTSSYNGDSLLAFTEAGYRFGQPAASAEPFVNLSYQRLSTDDFQEKGGAAAMSVSNKKMDTFYSTLGVRGSAELPRNVSLYGSLGWQHAYGDKATSSRMAFANSDAFVTQGTAVDKDVMVGDVGVSVQLTRSSAIGLGYQGQLGADTRSNAINANFRMSF